METPKPTPDKIASSSSREGSTALEGVEHKQIEGLFLSHCDDALLSIVGESGLIDYDEATDALDDEGLSLAEILPDDLEVAILFEDPDHVDEVARITAPDSPSDSLPSYVSSVLKVEQHKQDNPDDRTIRVPGRGYTLALMDLPSGLTLKRDGDALAVNVEGINSRGERATTTLVKDLTNLEYGGGWSIRVDDDQQSNFGDNARSLQLSEELAGVLKRAAKKATQEQE